MAAYYNKFIKGEALNSRPCQVYAVRRNRCTVVAFGSRYDYRYCAPVFCFFAFSETFYSEFYKLGYKIKTGEQ